MSKSIINCSFCYTIREVETDTEDLMIFEDRRLLKLLCGQISLPLTISDLRSPFKGFVSCPDCHKLYQTLVNLHGQYLQLKDHMRGAIEDLRSRIELSTSQQQTDCDDEVPCPPGRGSNYEDSNRSNDEKLRSAILKKSSLGWPRVCGSPWTLKLHQEPNGTHSDTPEESNNESAEKPTKAPSKPIEILSTSIQRTRDSDNAEKREMSVRTFGLTSGISFVPDPSSQQPVKPHTKLIRPPLINTSRVQPIQSPVPRNLGLQQFTSASVSVGLRIDQIPKIPSSVAAPVAFPTVSNNIIKRKIPLESFQRAPQCPVIKIKTSGVQMPEGGNIDSNFACTLTKPHEASECSYNVTTGSVDTSSSLNHARLLESQSNIHCGRLIKTCTSHVSQINGLEMSPLPKTTKKPRQRKSNVTAACYLNQEIEFEDFIGEQDKACTTRQQQGKACTTRQQQGKARQDNKARQGKTTRLPARRARKINSNKSTDLESEQAKPFECEFCGATTKFCDEEGLIEHLNSFHINDEKHHVCTITKCKKSFVSNLLLEKHLEKFGMYSYFGGHSKVPNRKRTVQVHSCEFCSQIIRSTTGVTFIQHILKHERDADEKPLKCIKCGKGYASTFLLTRHVKCHSQDRYKPLACEICDARFSKDDQQGLEKHKMTSSFHNLDVVVVAGKKTRKCRACEKHLSGIDGLRNHEYRQHPELRTHQCNVCDKTYVLKSFLETHLKTHSSTGPYTCSHCFKTCSSSETLGKHLISHTGLRCRAKFQEDQNRSQKFQCSICTRSFSLQGSLNFHKQRCRALRKCKICDKIFGNSSLLRIHKQSDHKPVGHKRTNKLLCEHCGKTYPTPSRMKAHLMSHVDKSKWEFVCYFCKKRFTCFDKLKAHMALHTLEKGFLCKKCQEIFMFDWQVKNHLKRRLCPKK